MNANWHPTGHGTKAQRARSRSRAKNLKSGWWHQHASRQTSVPLLTDAQWAERRALRDDHKNGAHEHARRENCPLCEMLNYKEMK